MMRSVPRAVATGEIATCAHENRTGSGSDRVCPPCKKSYKHRITDTEYLWTEAEVIAAVTYVEYHQGLPLP
jgi:hypothetical protein